MGNTHTNMSEQEPEINPSSMGTVYSTPYMMEIKDKYIILAIIALDFLRENTNVDYEIKEFTHIVIRLIEQKSKWEDVKDDEECCNMILYALEELEKRNFNNSSRILVGHYRSMMDKLRFWNKNRIPL